MISRIASLGLLFLLAVATVAAYQIPAAEALCVPPYGVGYPEAIAEGQNLYILWEYGTWESDGSSGSQFIQFKQSADNGKTFGETVNIYDSQPRCDLLPRMAADGSNVYIMWQDNGVLLRASNDNGTTFGETINLGSGWIGGIGAPDSYTDGGEVLASDDGVYAVWQSDDGNIVFRKSDDVGARFDPIVKLSQVGDSYRPKMDVFGSDVYVAWTENYSCAEQFEHTCESKVVFTKSDDYGQTFSMPTDLEVLTQNSLSMPVVLQMAADDKHVYILWREGGFFFDENSGEYITRSDDYAETFSEKISLLTFDDEYAYVSNVDVFGDAAYAIMRAQDRVALLKITDNLDVMEIELQTPELAPSEAR